MRVELQNHRAQEVPVLRIHQRPVHQSLLGQVAAQGRQLRRIQMPVGQDWYFVILAEKRAVVELVPRLQSQRVAVPEAGRQRLPNQKQTLHRQMVPAQEQQHFQKQRQVPED